MADKKQTLATVGMDTDGSVPILQLLGQYGQGGMRKGIKGADIGNRLLGKYASFSDLLPNLCAACIAVPLSKEKAVLTHSGLRNFATSTFSLSEFGIPNGSRVAVLLPNGPELAVTIIALLTRWCVVPINATYTSEEIRAELAATKAVAVIVLAEASVNDGAIEAARTLNIGVIVASPTSSISGLFHLALLQKVPETAASCSYSVARTVDGFQAFDHPETVLLLHTSGTSGNKKLVPYSLDMIVTGVGCIIASWDLRPSDVCLNMMPLFHIGGIMRNILSPILSGGCVITCSGFDPLLFWDVLSAPQPNVGVGIRDDDYSHNAVDSSSSTPSAHNHHNDSTHTGTNYHALILPTWYYAAPTMHHAILMEAERRPHPLPVQTVRYIANAAGGLLPVLADALKSTFTNAVILTSYGMTECMPISTPPQSYDMDPTGTSGMQVGPDIVITDDDMKPVSIGVKGNIMVRGPPCFGGYENNFAANDESFFEINGLKGWFNTGDMGSLDEQGYLFISGRSKEIINRGGETISPFEIEEAIQQHPSVKETLAFSAPHEQYQETVGCVIVTRPGQPRVDLPTLHQFLEDKLHRSKWPYVIVYSDGLPKNSANKILRIRYAERAGLKAVNEETSPISRLYEAPCPPIGAPLSTPIALQHITIDGEAARQLLASQPSVETAVVTSVDLPFKPASLVAFVVLTDGPSNLWCSSNDDDTTHPVAVADTVTARATQNRNAESYFHQLCVQVLHSYEVPECVYVLPTALPRKLSVVEDAFRIDESDIDFHALSSLARRLYSERNVTKPRNAIEAQMEYIWRHELLGNPNSSSSGNSDRSLSMSISSIISVTASFFDLGGDSLKAGQLINAIRKRMSIQHLAVTDLFAAPTIELLSQRVTAMHTLGTSSLHTNIDRRRHNNNMVNRKNNGAPGQSSSLWWGTNNNSIPATAAAAVNTSSNAAAFGEEPQWYHDTSYPPDQQDYHHFPTPHRNSRGGGNYYHLYDTEEGTSSSYNNDDDDDEEEEEGFRDDEKVKNGDDDTSVCSSEKVSPFSSTSFGCLFVQALPLVVILPLRRVVIWLLVAALWVKALNSWGLDRLYALMLAIAISRVIISIVAPLVGVLAKWIIIGRFKPGKYPLWGNMYLRWWIVEQIITIMGTGIFQETQVPFVGTHLTRLYYTLMGASIGPNFKVHKDAQLGQFDLLQIGSDVSIDASTVRCFALEEGHFILLPITIGDRCSIGIKSVIAPGTDLPADTHLGPLSSSYEIHTTNANYRKYCRPAYPSSAPPNYLTVFLGGPILSVIFAVELVPWLYGLHLMVNAAKSGGWYDSDINSMYEAFKWWTEPQRLCYYFVLRLIRRCCMPFIQLAIVVIIKRTLIGKFVPMNAEEKAKPWNRFRYWLMSKLLSGPHLCGVAQLVGTHYEIISVIFRLLGSKIGKRVYWPGSGLDIVEYDLLEVGDDVVFGSRSVILTISATRSAPVVFESGSMVADRCVILPGVRLGRGAVFGSGSLAPEDMVAPVGSIWVGSTEGSAVNMAPADLSCNTKDTCRPFGRAFYDRKATFTVLPLSVVVAYSVLWQAFCTLYRSISLPLSLIVASSFLSHYDTTATATASITSSTSSTNSHDPNTTLPLPLPRGPPHYHYTPFQVFEITYSFFAPLHLAFCLSAIIFDICMKWLLMGRRAPGLYPWDESSYCQRWQVYLTLEEIRRGERRKTGVLDMIQGSQYLVWYFRALGARIGRDVCLYPNGGDPMMTEPDLVTIGDGASIDDASLIAHINTRGIFRLNPLVVGRGCVLRSGTRLLSGSSMDAHSAALEHTLVLSGECVDSGSVWQGWPGKAHSSLAAHRKSINMRIGQEIRNRRNAADRGATTTTTTGTGTRVAHNDYDPNSTTDTSTNSSSSHAARASRYCCCSGSCSMCATSYTSVCSVISCSWCLGCCLRSSSIRDDENNSTSLHMPLLETQEQRPRDQDP